jgi:CheY-like chemotaxis protein
VTILVADDSVTMRRIVEMTFAGEKDIRVVSVSDGNGAIQKASELKPDVVITDGSMPGVDGYEVARAIKGDGGLSNTAVILMASQKNPYDDARGKASGVDDHIIKPFDSQHMIDRVQQVLGKPRNTAQGGAPLPKPATVQMSSPMSATVPNVPAPVISAPHATRGKPSPVGLDSPMARAAAPVVSRAPAAPMSAAKPAAAVSRAPQAPIASSAAAATSANGDLATKLAGLGLSADQVAGVLTLSREVIEQVVWEVVPDLAETIIREEITRLTAE